MKNIAFGLMQPLIVLILLAATSSLSAQTVAHQRNQQIQRGQNFSNWLEANWQTDYPNASGYTRQSVLEMKNAGMKSLRLPVIFEALTDDDSPYTLHTDNAVFELIDSAIVWAADFDMILIIDNHHGWEVSTGNYLQQIPRMAAMWKQLAEHYNYLDPDRYLFEIWNEPPLLLPESIIRPFYQACLDSIRTVTTQHSLIIGAHAANLGLALAITTPYSDDNIIYTFHCYEPYNFTHQGFPWAQPFPFPSGTPFPLNNNDTLLTNVFNAVANWRDTNNVPVFLGEFGVGIHADDQSRCNWVGLVGSLVTNLNIPWIYWDWQYDFSWFTQLPPNEDDVISCFRNALYLYEDIAVGNQPNIDHNPLVVIYPNPANNDLAIKTTTDVEMLQVQVRDLAGKVCKIAAFDKVDANIPLTINVSDIEPGIYFVSCVSHKWQITIPLLLR